MKKFFRISMIAALTALLLTACGDEDIRETEITENSTLQTGDPEPHTTKSLPSIQEVFGSDGIVWRYLDDPLRLAEINNTDWTKPGFDDSDWAEGTGSFGAREGGMYEFDGGLKTDLCLRQYLPNGEDIPAYYFRVAFEMDNTESTGFYDLRLIYDDAVIIYLNGKSIFEANVPEGGYSTTNEYGCEEVVESPKSEFFTLNTDLLQSGENVLAVELHQSDATSRDIYFDLQVRDENWLPALRNHSLSLGVGGDDSEMLVTWQGQGTEGYVEVVAAKDAEKDFFTNAAVYQAEAVYTNDWGANTFRAVLTDLESGQEYLYRVTDMDSSITHTFSVPDGGEEYSFIAVGDPQILDESDPQPIAIYEDIISQAMDGRKPDLILSLGDQSDDADDPELYLHYLSAAPLKEVPLAVVVGNHELEFDVFSRVFYVPNMDEETISSSGDMSGDYWFYRNHTLFLCLNSNEGDVEAHQDFINEAREECLARYGQPDWIIAVYHHSIFSAGSHAAGSDILKRRKSYVPMFEEAGVDVVFSGHDHTYTRSFPMDGTTPLNDGENGIVYFTLGSSTGTKYYELSEEEMDYAAVVDGSQRPFVTRVDVTKTAMTVTTYVYQTDGSLSVLDSYEITKE